MSFFIWPREAALLGCALQEYLDSCDLRLAFVDVLIKRLRPYYPPVRRTLVAQVSMDDVPPDIAWEPRGSVLRVGFARSLPESWFLAGAEVDQDLPVEVEQPSDALESFVVRLINERIAVRFTRADPTARNPLDMIVELVAAHIARRPEDDATFNLTTADMPWGLVQQRGVINVKIPRAGEDDEDAIEAALDNLASEYNCTDLFDAGRLVGGALAECENGERKLFHLLLIAKKGSERFAQLRTDWRAKLAERLARLQESPVLDPYGNAAAWLRHLAENTGCPSRLDPEKWEDDSEDDDVCDTGEWQDDVADDIRKLSEFRNAVWLAFGEILHAAQDAPERGEGAVPRLEAAKMLRLIRLTEESTPDKIRGTLQWCQEVFERGDVSAFPDQVPLCLGPAISVLAGRVWPKRFTELAGQHRTAAVLQEGLRDTDDRRCLFASIALTLWKQYRNPNNHEFERVAPSLLEALFFFVGVRQLFELSEAICGESINGP